MWDDPTVKWIIAVRGESNKEDFNGEDIQRIKIGENTQVDWKKKDLWDPCKHTDTNKMEKTCEVNSGLTKEIKEIQTERPSVFHFPSTCSVKFSFTTHDDLMQDSAIAQNL